MCIGRSSWESAEEKGGEGGGAGFLETKHNVCFDWGGGESHGIHNWFVCECRMYHGSPMGYTIGFFLKALIKMQAKKVKGVIEIIKYFEFLSVKVLKISIKYVKILL